MTPTEAMITAARRYCMDNSSFWYDKYSQEGSGSRNYTDRDYDLFPRYNVLGAILVGVESIVGRYFSSLDDCKAELKQIGLVSNSLFTEGKKNRIESSAIQDERNKFAEFIDGITQNDLGQVEPLPYKRTLNTGEAKQIRRQLLGIWNFDGGYWEPLEDRSPKPTVFVMWANITDRDIEKIVEVVGKRADKKIFWIEEDRIDYETETESFTPKELYETICCDKNFDWVVYGSHESTLAFGGTWLIETVEKLFSDRKDKLNFWKQNW